MPESSHRRKLALSVERGHTTNFVFHPFSEVRAQALAYRAFAAGVVAVRPKRAIMHRRKMHRRRDLGRVVTDERRAERADQPHLPAMPG